MFTKNIPCLDMAAVFVKGVNFVNLKDPGDPVEIAKAYDKAGMSLCFWILHIFGIQEIQLLTLCDVFEAGVLFHLQWAAVYGSLIILGLLQRRCG